MKLTQASLKNPAIVAVVAVMIALLGVLSLTKIPLQLLPDIEKPIMSVITAWPGASPSEMESEIAKPLEDVLRGASGLTDIDSFAFADTSFIQLTYAIGTDMDQTMIDLVSRLARVRPLPASSQKPVLLRGEWNNTGAALIEYFVQKLPGTPGKISDHSKFFRDEILPELQSLYGVARIDFTDGSSVAGSGNVNQLTRSIMV